MSNHRSSAALAEALGTFALTFVGILSVSGGSAVGQHGLADLTNVALAQGFVVTAMAAALGGLSGAHFNPAVTLGFVVTRRIGPGTALLYWAAQLSGALAAAYLLHYFFGRSLVGYGTPVLNPAMGTLPGATLEGVGALLLVLVYFGTAVDGRSPRGVFPLAVGLTVALNLLILGPLTGGALNPARVLGPAVASGQWLNHGVYWTGTLIGGALGALLAHHALRMRATTPVVAQRGGPAPVEQRGAVEPV